MIDVPAELQTAADSRAGSKPLAAFVAKTVRAIRMRLGNLVSASRIATLPRLTGHDLFDEIPVALCLADPSGQTHFKANRQALELFGYSLHEFRKLGHGDLLADPPGTPRAPSHLRLSTGQTMRDEQWLRRGDGATFPAEVTVRRLADRHLIFTYVEIQNRGGLDLQPPEGYGFTDSLVRNLPVVFLSFDENRRSVNWNRNLEAVSGYGADEIAEGDALMFVAPEDRTTTEEKIRQAFIRGRIDGEVQLLTKSGRKIPFHFTAVKTMLSQRECLVGMGVDISDRKRTEERIYYMAHHDILTQLPNRNVLDERIGHALASSLRNDGRFAVLFLDLDGFRDINDRLGHPVGDYVLQKTAVRIRESLRQTDSVGRFGGDEFLVLLSEIAHDNEPIVVAEKILAAVAQPITCKFPGVTLPIPISVSIGIALYPRHAASVHELITAADRALYAAKNAGKNCFQIAPKPARSR